jgi:hypothetical protein
MKNLMLNAQARIIAAIATAAGDEALNAVLCDALDEWGYDMSATAPAYAFTDLDRALGDLAGCHERIMLQADAPAQHLGGLLAHILGGYNRRVPGPQHAPGTFSLAAVASVDTSEPPAVPDAVDELDELLGMASDAPVIPAEVEVADGPLVAELERTKVERDNALNAAVIARRETVAAEAARLRTLGKLEVRTTELRAAQQHTGPAAVELLDSAHATIARLQTEVNQLRAQAAAVGGIADVRRLLAAAVELLDA